MDHDIVADVRAVIESARARDGEEALRAYVARRNPEADADGVARLTAEASASIDAIPDLLRRAHREAEERDVGHVVGPLLERAERYFLKPIDLMPEMTHGLPGLLDDAYLVVRTLGHLEYEDGPFLNGEVERMTPFLRDLLGEPLAERLDGIVREEIAALSERFEESWDRTSHKA